MWPIFMIVMSVAMIVGPIMMMQPSRGSVRVAKLRQAASHLGLLVYMAKGPHPMEDRPCAVYLLPWSPQTLKSYPNMPKWTLYRKSFEHEAHFFKDWDWLTPSVANQGWQQIIRDEIKHIPLGTQVLSTDKAGLKIFWQEKTGGQNEEEAVEKLHQWLERVAKGLLLEPRSV